MEPARTVIPLLPFSPPPPILIYSRISLADHDSTLHTGSSRQTNCPLLQTEDQQDGWIQVSVLRPPRLCGREPHPDDALSAWSRRTRERPLSREKAWPP